MVNSVNKLFPENPIRLYQARKVLRHKARDNGRTPVQWTSESPNAGFCPPDVKPWMRVNDDYADGINAEAETRDGVASVYHFWQGLLKLRKENKEVFVYGGFDLVKKEHPDVFAYVRTTVDGERWVSALNFTGKNTEWEVPREWKGAEWVVGNYHHGEGEDAAQFGGKVFEVAGDGANIKLRPWEGLLGRVVPLDN